MKNAVNIARLALKLEPHAAHQKNKNAMEDALIRMNSVVKKENLFVNTPMTVKNTVVITSTDLLGVRDTEIAQPTVVRKAISGATVATIALLKEHHAAQLEKSGVNGLKIALLKKDAANITMKFMKSSVNSIMNAEMNVTVVILEKKPVCVAVENITLTLIAIQLFQRPVANNTGVKNASLV